MGFHQRRFRQSHRLLIWLYFDLSIKSQEHHQPAKRAGLRCSWAIFNFKQNLMTSMNTPVPVPNRNLSGLMDRLFGWSALGAVILTLSMLTGILFSLFVGAWPAISQYGLGFLTRSVWDPVQNEFGGLVMIYGTLITSIIALLIAVPVSFGIALFLTELSPAWLKRPLGIARNWPEKLSQSRLQFVTCWHGLQHLRLLLPAWPVSRGKTSSKANLRRH